MGRLLPRPSRAPGASERWPSPRKRPVVDRTSNGAYDADIAHGIERVRNGNPDADLIVVRVGLLARRPDATIFIGKVSAAPPALP